MPEKFIIKGGKSLNGEVNINGAKNAAFPILAATLLTNNDCIIDNLPLIEDVSKMLKILESLGAEISYLSKRKVKINCQNINPEKIPFDIVSNFRGSILILGPLLARFGKIKIISPGGCLIGARPLDTHFDSFKQLGFKISSKGSFYYFEKGPDFLKTDNYFSIPDKEVKEGKKIEIVLKEFSVTATENILLFASLFSQKFILKIADEDYQTQDLIKVLKKMGVKIRRIEAHSFEIVGKKKLNGFTHKIISDPIETGTFIVAALATKGEVLIKDAEIAFLSLFLKKFSNSLFHLFSCIFIYFCLLILSAGNSFTKAKALSNHSNLCFIGIFKFRFSFSFSSSNSKSIILFPLLFLIFLHQFYQYFYLQVLSSLLNHQY